MHSLRLPDELINQKNFACDQIQLGLFYCWCCCLAYLNSKYLNSKLCSIFPF